MDLPYGARTDGENERDVDCEVEPRLVSQVRERFVEWRHLVLRGGGSVSRVTMELLNDWRRDGPTSCF